MRHGAAVLHPVRLDVRNRSIRCTRQSFAGRCFGTGDRNEDENGDADRRQHVSRRARAEAAPAAGNAAYLLYDRTFPTLERLACGHLMGGELATTALADFSTDGTTFILLWLRVGAFWAFRSGSDSSAGWSSRKRTSEPALRQWYDSYFADRYLGSLVARQIVGQPKSTNRLPPAHRSKRSCQ